MTTTLIVGGTGTVGSHLASTLVKQGATVKVGSRTPAKATVPAGATAVRLDVEDASSFAEALTGVDALFVLSPPGHVDQLALLQPLIDAAIKGGVKKIVTMTANGVQYDDTNPMRRLEKYVEASGVAHVLLRPGWFMQNFQTYWHGMITGGNVIALPAGDSLSAFIDARDISEVAAVALTTTTLDGQALALTGPRGITYAEAAAILSAASGRPITYVATEDAPFKAALLGAGLPEHYADLMVGLYATVRQGFAAGVDDSVAQILGSARTLEGYAKEYADAWRIKA